MDTARKLLGACGALMVGAAVALIAEHFGVSHDVSGKLFFTAAALLMIWVL